MPWGGGSFFFKVCVQFCCIVVFDFVAVQPPSFYISPVKQQVAAKPRDFVYQTVDCFTRPGSVQMVHEEEATVLKGE